jgi:carbon starvation protein CstA
MLLLEGFLVTTLDTAIRLTRYMIEEGWATFFGRYDVFAEAARATAEAPAPTQRGATELAGASGLTIDKSQVAYAQEVATVGPARPTRGAFRGLLLFLRQYWVNSGIAVALMLSLGLGNGWKMLWAIFGSANQLLAALALVVASCWLAARQRPVWYTLLPTLFMLATSATMLVRLLAKKFYPGLPGGGNVPLFVTAIVVLAMTVGIVVSAIRRYVFAGRATAAAA